jgi:hypothetical protein
MLYYIYILIVYKEHILLIYIYNKGKILNLERNSLKIKNKILILKLLMKIILIDISLLTLTFKYDIIIL